MNAPTTAQHLIPHVQQRPVPDALIAKLKAWNGQLAAQVEELVLHFHQHLAHVGRHVFAQQHANVGVQLIHLAHGVHAQTVFGHALVVAQAGGAIVAGAGGDLCESVAHDVVLSLFLFAQACAV